MEKEYAIGIDLGGTSVKYALIGNKFNLSKIVYIMI